MREVVGLDPGRETIETSTDEDGLELDLVTHDARKFFGLLLKKNGYVLEQVYSPLVVHTTPEHEELKAIARGCVTRHHSHHYFGFAETQWQLFEKERPRRVKPLLYVYRVLLTGIHLMRTGEVEANLVRLNEEARLAHVDDLIARKLAGPEQSALDDADVAFHRREYERLRAELEAAHQASTLPEAPSARPALNDLLVRLRMQIDRLARPLIEACRSKGSRATSDGGMTMKTPEPDPRLAPVPGVARAPARPAPLALARGLAPPDRLLGLVRQGHRLAPARRRPPQALRSSGTATPRPTPRPASSPHEALVAYLTGSTPTGRRPPAASAPAA